MFALLIDLGINFLWNLKRIKKKGDGMLTVFFKRHWLTILGVVAGAIGGFLYWRFVGCSTGTCPITSSPVNSSIWGAIMGGLLLSMFKREKDSAR